MPKLYSNLLETIGNTPIVKVNSLQYDNLYAKIEYFNPAGSIKDRVAFNMLQKAQEKNLIDNKTVIIEPTSGNTGIGLAFCASIMGLKFIAVMPENMSLERIKLMKAYGAEIVLTPKEGGIKASVDKANEISEQLKNNGKKTFIPSQFENMDNPLSHIQTAKEILEQTDGKIDILVACIGTGGTITGIAKELKKYNKNIKIVGVEAKESPLLTKGISAPHKIQGISANFIPKTLDLSVVDTIIDISGDDAYNMAKGIAKNEGLLIGISSGASLCGAIEASKIYNKDNPMIVAILPDNGERYLSGDLYVWKFIYRQRN